MQATSAPTNKTALRFLAVLLLCPALASIALADDPSTLAKDMNPSQPIELRAGDIRLKFQDGQLRYLRVGDREIVRRVYFAVRDGNWATIQPRFVHASIRQSPDGFEINLAAECRHDPVNLKWTGHIKGTPDGKITFQAEGTAGGDFQSNRIGLCVLYGLPSLSEQAFETFESAEGTSAPTPGRFPPLVSPVLVAQNFKLLRYTSPEGYPVSVSVEGATFDMEDQRNWGDASFKAFAPLPYAYPNVKKDQKFAQRVLITSNGSTGLDKYAERQAVHLRIGGPIAGAKVPKVGVRGKEAEGVKEFVDINRGRDKYAGASAVSWLYESDTHLPDDDTLMENPPALFHQANTIRSFVPKATLRVFPVRPQHDAPFDGAWAAEALRALSIAGVDEAWFSSSGDLPAPLADIAAHVGKPVLSAEPVDEPGSARQAWAVQALAVRDGNATIVWIINRTPEKSQAVLEGLGPAAKVTQLNVTTDAAAPKPIDSTGETTISVDLGPYGVYRIEPKR